jgi:glycosyltransferase involved in cell wall biosynthesis
MLASVRDTPPRYREADVFVSPSVSDNLPNTVLESMACGTPVIISDMCGLRCIVDHGVNGFVYRYDDVDALAGHLRWCSENPEELAAMGRRAREKAVRFPKADFATQLLGAIDDLEPTRPARLGSDPGRGSAT